MRKIGLATLLFAVVVASSTLLLNAEDKGAIKLGGHTKLQLFDEEWGTAEVTGVNYNGSDQRSAVAYGAHEVIFYVSKDINENFSVEIAPNVNNGFAGATPKLGYQIGQQRRSTAYTNAPSLSFQEAFVKMNVPQYKLELRAGSLNVPFTQDYGKELFWHEEYNGSKFSCNTNLGAWHDTGFEAYRNFELGSVSLPAYLYLLNGDGGTQYTDNNANKTILLHAEPSFSGNLAGLKTFISYGFGKWGDRDWQASYTTATPAMVDPSLQDQGYHRYSLGANYDYQKFSFRAEYAAGEWDNYYNYGTITQTNKSASGYYFKVFYHVTEKLKVMLHYDLATQWVSASNSGYASKVHKETYPTTTLGAQYELAEASTLIFQYDMANWKDNEVTGTENALNFNRLTVGVRVTF